MSPTPEELRQYGFALSLRQEVDAWLENRHPTMGAALVAAAQALGLEPVQFHSDEETDLLSPPARKALEWAMELMGDCNASDEIRALMNRSTDPALSSPKETTTDYTKRIIQKGARFMALAKTVAQEDEGFPVVEEPAQQTVFRLRQAIESALEDASVEGRLWDGRAAYVAIEMRAYQGLVDALSSPKEAERP